MPKTFPTCLVLTLALFTACGDDSHGVGGHDDPTPVFPPVAGSAPPVAGAGGSPRVTSSTLIVANRYNTTFTGLYVSPSYEDKWGPNLLQGRSLTPGGSAEVVVTPCDDYYDLRVTAGSSMGQLREIYLECGGRRQVTFQP